MEINIDKCKDEAKIFKAFCDENRIFILRLLQEGERCACVLLEKLQISQPTLSHHMKILCESGVVIPRKDGKWTHYSISQNGIEKAREFLEQIKPDYICYCAKVTKDSLKKAVAAGAKSVEEAIEKTGAMQNSNCAKNNPKGTCCYPDIAAAFNEIKNELQQSCFQKI